MARKRKRPAFPDIGSLPDIFSEAAVAKIYRESFKRQDKSVDITRLREHILIGVRVYISDVSELSVSEAAEQLSRLGTAAQQMKRDLVFKNWNKISPHAVQIADRCCGRATVLSDLETRDLFSKPYKEMKESELRRSRQVCRELSAISQAVAQQAAALHIRDRLQHRAPKRRDPEFLFMLHVELGLVSSTIKDAPRFYAAREDQSPSARFTIACLRLAKSPGVTVRHLIESRRQLFSAQRKMGPNWWVWAMNRQGIPLMPRMYRGAG
jgi:hypothetical protein